MNFVHWCGCVLIAGDGPALNSMLGIEVEGDRWG